MGIIKISLFMSLGTLTLTLVECKLTRDVKTMRKMDPYCSLTMREQEWRSATCECGSKKPKWEDAKVDLNIKYLGDDIYYTFSDDDPGKDEKICSGQSKVSTWCAEPEMDMWVELEWKGKSAGKAHFTSVWSENAVEIPKEEHESEMELAQTFMSEFEASDAKADEDKERKLARIAEMQDNEEEEHAKELEQLAASIEETKAADQERYDGVAEEIKAVAEELLEINEKMQDYLTKMCEL